MFALRRPIRAVRQPGVICQDKSAQKRLEPSPQQCGRERRRGEGCRPKAELTGASPAEEKKLFLSHDLFLWVLPGTPHLSFHVKVLPLSRLSALPACPKNGSDVCALPCTAQPFLGYHSTYYQSEQCPVSMLGVQYAQRWPDPTEKAPLLSHRHKLPITAHRRQRTQPRRVQNPIPSMLVIFFLSLCR